MITTLPLLLLSLLSLSTSYNLSPPPTFLTQLSRLHAATPPTPPSSQKPIAISTSISSSPGNPLGKVMHSGPTISLAARTETDLYKTPDLYQRTARDLWLGERKSATGKFGIDPKLITLDCTGTLIRLTSDVGMYYREELFALTDHRARLPRPDIFTESFMKSYAAKEATSPNFGTTKGETSEQWWREVVWMTYKNIPHIDLEPTLREQLEDRENGVFDELFNNLYYNVFSTKLAWELRGGVFDFLTKLSKWKKNGRQNNGMTNIPGPKIGVISNFDERLHAILRELEIDHFFDFVITSREAACAKPDAKIFSEAINKLSILTNEPKMLPEECVHIGDSLNKDITGAYEAGWHGIYIEPDTYDTSSSPDNFFIQPSSSPSSYTTGSSIQNALIAKINDKREFSEVGDIWSVLHMFDIKVGDRIISTTKRVREGGVEGGAQHDFTM